jgi:anti-sigma regulatory factor (Ser/Thr protein kinase)
MVEPLKITITSNPAHIRVVRTAVETFSGRNGFTQTQAHQIGLAVNEALANVIEHGYQGNTDQTIHVSVEMVGEDRLPERGIRVVIRDFGQQVDPECIKSRDLDDIRPGGLGVHIMRTVMDKVVYRCLPDGGMELTMLKYMNPSVEVKR